MSTAQTSPADAAAARPVPDADKPPKPWFKTVEVIANTASGSVGPGAPDELAQILAEFGIAANVCTPASGDLTDCLRKSIRADPDLLVVLAGDGTARAAAELCGPEGPVLAPLAGGTMNMLPHAVYGVQPWQDALRQVLEGGETRMLGGGQIGEHRFLVAAILGSPALWAHAREAARDRDIPRAITKARQAMRRAFTGRLRYKLDAQPRAKAEALVLMCPVASSALSEDAMALEAAVLDVHGAGDALRLGFNALVRDWRTDRSVETHACQGVQVWSAQAIPALLDGETVRLGSSAQVRFDPRVVRVLAPPTNV